MARLSEKTASSEAMHQMDGIGTQRGSFTPTNDEGKHPDAEMQ